MIPAVRWQRCTASDLRCTKPFYLRPEELLRIGMQKTPDKFAEGDAKLLKKEAHDRAYETTLYTALAAVNLQENEPDLSKYDSELADITAIKHLMFLVRVGDQQIPESVKREVLEESRRGVMEAIVDVELAAQETEGEENED